MKDTFVDLVRDSKKNNIKQPTQKGFTIEAWITSYKKCGDTSASAENLFEAGKWTFFMLEKIRKKVNSLKIINFDKDKALRMLVGISNRNIKMLHDEKVIHEATHNNTLIAEQLIQYKVTNNVTGAKASPDDVLSQNIDGIRFPITILSEAGGEKPYLSDDKEVLTSITAIYLLGEYYDITEELWLGFLWRNLKILDKDDYFLITPEHDDYAMNLVVSDYRFRSLLLQYVREVIGTWNQEITPLMRQATQKNTRIEISGSGKSKQYILCDDNTNNAIPPITTFAQTFAMEQYYEGLLDEKLQTLHELSLHQILKAWEILSAIVRAELLRFPANSEVFKIQTLLQYAPTISPGNICKLFIKGLVVRYEQAHALIKFLTYIPSPRNELWDAPLIQLSNEKMAIIAAPLIHGNLLRILEKFMKKGGLDIASKGDAFEIFCRNQIKKAILNNNILSNSGVCQKGLLLETPSDKEELDIVIWLNETILIGEAKCLETPSTPLEFYNYFETLKGATQQAKRKAQFVNANSTALLDKIGLTVATDSLNIKPFVITNSPFGVGLPIDDVPVTDLKILCQYLKQNKFEQYVLFSSDGEKLSTGKTTIIYETEKEAACKIYDYLRLPPHISLYTKHIKFTENPVSPLNAGDKPFFIGRYEVQLPFPQ